MKISISIDVPDLALAEKFYTEALACKKVRAQGENMIILEVDKTNLYLIKCAANSHPIPSKQVKRTYERHWTPVHLDFLCDDVNRTVENIVLHGGSCENKESGEWGSIAYCVDPFGNGLCIINEKS